MSNKIKVSPSILASNFSMLGEEVEHISNAGADYIHVDVMDGHFVPNLTIGPDVVKSIRDKTAVPFDVHLMIDPIEPYIDGFVNAGADIITFHPEATPNVSNTINLIKKEGKKVGVSLKPKSEIELIEKYIEQVDLILIMSVEPGFGGQKFIPEVLDKTKKIRKLVDQKKLNIEIEIDGGINFDNCAKVKEAGANVLVSGSTIFKENKGDLKKNIEILKTN